MMKKLIDKCKFKKNPVFKEHLQRNNQHFAIKTKHLKVMGINPN